MEKLTQIEKEEIAFLIRQEINDGKKAIEGIVIPTNEIHLEYYNKVVEGFKTRKQKLETIAKKLEIEL